MPAFVIGENRVGYQPCSATTVLSSAHMSAITARAPALLRWVPGLGLVRALPTKCHVGQRGGNMTRLRFAISEPALGSTHGVHLDRRGQSR